MRLDVGRRPPTQADPGRPGPTRAPAGDIPRARLASAEQQIMSGQPREALQNAEAAEQGLPRESTDWIRAGDVALQARAELERESERN